MSAQNIKEMLAYNAWANQRILDTASHLTENQRQAPMPKGFSAGSLHNTLRHVLFAEWTWLRRCLGKTVTSLDFPDKEVETFETLTGEHRLYLVCERKRRKNIEKCGNPGNSSVITGLTQSPPPAPPGGRGNAKIAPFAPPIGRGKGWVKRKSQFLRKSSNN